MAPNNYFNATLKTQPFIEHASPIHEHMHTILFSLVQLLQGLCRAMSKHAFSHLNLDYNYVFKQCILTVAIAMLPAYTLFI